MYKALLLQEGGGIISKNSVSPQIGSASVLIGIGGIGISTLRQVKKEVYQHLEPDDPNGPVPEYKKIAFLGIDTDTYDVNVNNPDVSELQPDEMVPINLPNGRKLLWESRSDPSLAWLSDGIRHSLSPGPVRQLCRFCLFKNISEVHSKLSDVIAQVIRAAQKSTVQVHIFAGLSGGTGSGCFLDICYLVRSILDEIGIGSTICGYFFLPDTMMKVRGIRGIGALEKAIKRNGYAALRDLDYCMSFPVSGSCFKENYAPGISVASSKAPVDFCVLVSATNGSGEIRPDGYQFCVRTVAQYILTSLSDVQPGPNLNDHGFTIEWLCDSVHSGLNAIKPSVGAERHYNFLGASSAEMPFTDIVTYLAGVTYRKLTPSLGRHATDPIVQEFAEANGISAGGLAAELTKGTVGKIAFDPEMGLPQTLNEGDENWEQTVPGINAPYTSAKSNMEARIQENYAALMKDLDSYDAMSNAVISDPPFLIRIFNRLVETALDPEKGPTMAADLLHMGGCKDLRTVLSGVNRALTLEAENLKRKEPICVRQIQDAAHSYNRAILGKRRKFEDYEIAWNDYLKNKMNQLICERMKALIPTLTTHMENMYNSYFCPLRDMIEELRQTFEANLAWLDDPGRRSEDGVCWHIFEYEDVKEDLDNQVLNKQDLKTEHRDFVQYLLDHYNEWTARNHYRVARCVNSYMVDRFNTVINLPVDNYLMKVVNPADLPKLLNEVKRRAEPLFWRNPVFQYNDDTTVSRNVLSIPSGSPAILSTSKAFCSEGNPTVVVGTSTLKDRVSCLRFVSGIPIYAYQGLDSLKVPYEEASGEQGLHLHERDVNWRQILPTLVPYSINLVNGSVSERDQKRAELYEKAVQAGIIGPKSPRDIDTYVVRILPDTSAAVAAYRKESYFFAGMLRKKELDQDIQALKLYRDSLLPEDAGEGAYLQLLNDGHADPVRRDYFVRFGALCDAAKESLRQLSLVDAKLAEMENWKAFEQERRDPGL